MKSKPRPAEETFSMTPMIDISFLLIIFFILLPLKGFDFKLQCYLPRDSGIVPMSAPPKVELIKPESEKTANNTPTSVIPTPNFLVRYRAKKGYNIAPPTRSMNVITTRVQNGRGYS